MAKTAAPTTNSELADGIQRQILQLADQARDGLQALDERITQLRERHAAIVARVDQGTAAAAIVGDVEAFIEDDADMIRRTATAAAFAGNHVALNEICAIKGDGTYDVRKSSPSSRLGIFSGRDFSPAVLLEILDPDRRLLRAWAMKVAAEAGCPKTGPSPAEIAEHGDELMREILDLMAERQDAERAFQSLLGESAGAIEASQAMKRMLSPVAEGKPDVPSSTRPAGVYDADGKPLSAIGSDPWHAAMEHRRRAAELQAAAEIGTPDALLAAADRRDDAGLRHGLN